MPRLAELLRIVNENAQRLHSNCVPEAARHSGLVVGGGWNLLDEDVLQNIFSSLETLDLLRVYQLSTAANRAANTVARLRIADSSRPSAADMNQSWMVELRWYEERSNDQMPWEEFHLSNADEPYDDEDLVWQEFYCDGEREIVSFCLPEDWDEDEHTGWLSAVARWPLDASECMFLRIMVERVDGGEDVYAYFGVTADPVPKENHACLNSSFGLFLVSGASEAASGISGNWLPFSDPMEPASSGDELVCMFSPRSSELVIHYDGKIFVIHVPSSNKRYQDDGILTASRPYYFFVSLGDEPGTQVTVTPASRSEQLDLIDENQRRLDPGHPERTMRFDSSGNCWDDARSHAHPGRPRFPTLRRA